MRRLPFAFPWALLRRLFPLTRPRRRALGAAALLAASGCTGLATEVSGRRPGDGEDERLCEASLSLAGSLTASEQKPEDVSGCWPVGTWAFSATVDESSCPNGPALEPQYAFRVYRDPEQVETYTYLNDPAQTRVRMKVTSGGAGLCMGSFELFSADGTAVLTLKPSLFADQSIKGGAEYSVWSADRWTPPDE